MPQAITHAHRARWARFPEVGCMACGKRGLVNKHTQAHHLLSGGRRVGHLATIPLCPWHHQGYPEPLTYTQARLMMGPSLAKEPREFRAEFGNDEALLSETDAALGRLTCSAA